MVEHVTHGLRALLRAMGAQRDMPTITRQWSTLVGERLAAHCHPSQLTDGTLVVVADDPGWATEMRFAQGALLGALDELLKPGTVTSVKVAVGRPATG